MTIRKRLLIGLHTRRHKPAENPGSPPSLMSREAWESKTTPSEGHRREYPGGRSTLKFSEEVVDESLLEEENALDSDDQEMGF